MGPLKVQNITVPTQTSIGCWVGIRGFAIGRPDRINSLFRSSRRYWALIKVKLSRDPAVTPQQEYCYDPAPHVITMSPHFTALHCDIRLHSQLWAERLDDIWDILNINIILDFAGWTISLSTDGEIHKKTKRQISRWLNIAITKDRDKEMYAYIHRQTEI